MFETGFALKNWRLLSISRLHLPLRKSNAHYLIHKGTSQASQYSPHVLNKNKSLASQYIYHAVLYKQTDVSELLNVSVITTCGALPPRLLYASITWFLQNFCYSLSQQGKSNNTMETVHTVLLTITKATRVITHTCVTGQPTNECRLWVRTLLSVYVRFWCSGG
jgi:hypothetical protein